MLSSISNRWLALIVVLVAGLGLTAGYMLLPIIESTQATPILVPINNTTLNQNTVNNTTGNIQSNQKTTISASQAIAIANKHAAAYNYTATNIVNYIPGPVNGVSENSYWKVVLKNKNPRDEHVRLYVFIDAVTGKVIRG